MIAVSDTSPICYLILIGEIDVLPQIYSKILVPTAVIDELVHEDAPESVRTWAASLPSWISAQQNPSGAITGMEKLQAGERAAIMLAESMLSDMILLDERSARRVAADRGLRITGTLGVLGEAAARGSVDLATAIDRLSKTNFRCHPALLKAVLDRFGKR